MYAFIPDWFETSGTEIGNSWPWIIAVGLGITIVGFIWRNFVRPRVKSEMTDEIKKVVDEALKPVIHELKPNGGGSIKDQINRIEAKTTSLEKMHQETQETVNKLVTENTLQNFKLDELWQQKES